MNSRNGHKVKCIKGLKSREISKSGNNRGIVAVYQLTCHPACSQVFLDIACPDGGGRGADGQKTKSEGVADNPTHEEIRPNNILSMLANLTPWSNYNQSPRNMYQCQVREGKGVREEEQGED